MISKYNEDDSQASASDFVTISSYIQREHFDVLYGIGNKFGSQQNKILASHYEMMIPESVSM